MGHGLKHPDDLAAWRRWHESRHPVRGIAHAAQARLRPPARTLVDVLTPLDAGDILVAVEATHASVDRAVVAPLRHLPVSRTAIVSPVGWLPPDAYANHHRRTVPLEQLSTLVTPIAVLAAGHYSEIGAISFALAQRVGAQFLVSQHGALTPFAPPLPPGAHLLAWTDADADFWTVGRRDVRATSTGGQLLWEAGAKASTRPVPTAEHRLTYLGQGHAAEIPRARLVHAALATCREHNAVYRPHPSERDVACRLTLAAYARAGIALDTTGVPLVELTSPVVGVFSTGVVEAAARGIDAWVDFPRPPAWLGEFWERYGMSRFGQTPTPAPPRTEVEPARRIAEIILGAMP